MIHNIIVKGFLIDGLSATQGYRSIGTCVIPDTEESVYISTNISDAIFTTKIIGLNLMK